MSCLVQAPGLSSELVQTETSTGVSPSGGPTQVRIDRHNNLQIRSALLALEPGTRVHTRNMAAATSPLSPWWVDMRQEQAQMPQGFSTVFKLSFSWRFTWLLKRVFSRVLTKLVLIISACFSMFLLRNKSSELPTPPFY